LVSVLASYDEKKHKELPEVYQKKKKEGEQEEEEEKTD
jgi:hypothetical protein